MAILESQDEKSLLILMVAMHRMGEEHLAAKTAPKLIEVQHICPDILLKIL